MAKAKSSLLASLGAEALEAHEEFKSTPVIMSAGGDPPPIENGVAKLTEIRFSKIEDEQSENFGKLQFYASGVIVSPKAVEVNGNMVPVEGLRTRIIEPLYETPTRTRKSVKDHLAKVYNELKKLGLDTSSMKLTDIEESLPTLAEAGIHFRFRIWKGKKQTTGPYANQEPIANHEWNGLIEYEDETVDDVIEEVPVKAPSKSTSPSKSKPATEDVVTPKAEAPTKPAAKGKAPSKPAEVDVANLTLEELVEKSTANHVPSQIELTARAKAVGIDAESDEYENWQQVADAMEATVTSSEEESSETVSNNSEEINWDVQGESADNGDQDSIDLIHQTAIELGLDPDQDSAWSETASKIKETLSSQKEEWVPSVGETYLYKAPKTKVAVPCEVVAVFEGKKTVNLKSEKATFKNISWEELTGE